VNNRRTIVSWFQWKYNVIFVQWQWHFRIRSLYFVAGGRCANLNELLEACAANNGLWTVLATCTCRSHSHCRWLLHMRIHVNVGESFPLFIAIFPQPFHSAYTIACLLSFAQLAFSLPSLFHACWSRSHSLPRLQVFLFW